MLAVFVCESGVIHTLCEICRVECFRTNPSQPCCDSAQPAWLFRKLFESISICILDTKLIQGSFFRLFLTLRLATEIGWRVLIYRKTIYSYRARRRLGKTISQRQSPQHIRYVGALLRLFACRRQCRKSHLRWRRRVVYLHQRVYADYLLCADCVRQTVFDCGRGE